MSARPSLSSVVLPPHMDAAYGQWKERVIVAGGIACSWEADDATCKKQGKDASARVDVYSLTKANGKVSLSRVRPGPALPYATSHAAGAISTRGVFHVSGGYRLDAPLGQPKSWVAHWSWDVANKARRWVRRAPLPSPRGAHGCAFMADGRMYCVGGGVSDWGPYLNELLIYSPLSDSWEAGPPMPTARDHLHLSTVALAGRLWVFGGRSTRDASGRSPWGGLPSARHWVPSAELEAFDPSARSWRVLRPLVLGRAGVHAVVCATCGGRGKNASIVLLGGKVYTGTTSQHVAVVEEYLPDEDAYFCHPPLERAVSGASVGAMALTTGISLVLAGGSYSCGFGASGRMLQYTSSLSRRTRCGYLRRHVMPSFDVGGLRNPKACAARWYQPALDAPASQLHGDRMLSQLLLRATKVAPRQRPVPPAPGALLSKVQGAARPASSSWVVRDDVTLASHQEGATAQWGPNLIIAAGVNASLAQAEVLLQAKGWPGWAHLGSSRVELYNLVDGSVSDATPLPYRTNHPAGAISAEGVFHVSGGFYQDAPPGQIKSWVEHRSWDVANNASGWVRRAPLPSPRGGHGCAFMADGRMYCVGGGVEQWGPYLNELQIYSPLSDSWEAGPPMPAARDHVQTSVLVLLGNLYVFGGRTTTDRSGANCKLCATCCLPHDFRMLSTLDIFLAAERRWVAGQPSPGPPRGALVATPITRSIRGKTKTTALLVGGESFNVNNGFAQQTVEEYDPETDLYYCHPPLPLQSFGGGLGCVGLRCTLVSGAEWFGVSSTRRVMEIDLSRTALPTPCWYDVVQSPPHAALLWNASSNRATPYGSSKWMKKDFPAGPSLPNVCLGHGHPQSSESEAERAARWLTLGGRGFDTALSYRNHEQIGSAILDSRVARGSVYVSTKVKCHPNISSLTAVAMSLLELRVGQLNQVLLHMPCTTLNATMAAWAGLQLAHRRGLTMSIGLSNFPLKLVRRLIGMGPPLPALNQVQMSVGSHHPNVVAELLELGVTPQAYSPLLGLSALITDPRVSAASQRTGRSSAQVLLRWLTQQRVPVVTSPSSFGEHMLQDLDASLDFNLSSSEMAALATVQLECPSYRNCALLAGASCSRAHILPPACCCSKRSKGNRS
ncbi:hypothetical protein AB1Y20_020870 [Prymnesium parvum]|uniref:NADP-dependent oxidoreductase domain-containing protein n=1 Tax=Prymnesium parvum TaxID=97485 RepID=A0AB34JUS5_PRYPA